MPALSVSPIVAVLEHLEVEHDAVSVAPVTDVAVLSLVDALAQVPDPRKPRGVRHGVLAVLLLGACAVLTGARSFAAIAEYAHDAGAAVLEVLGVGVVAPHESTIRRVLQRVDASALEAALQPWVLAQLEAQSVPAGTPRRAQRRVLAVDGKTPRGARVRAADGGGCLPHLVSVLDQASGVVLGQVQVEPHGSEITAFTTVLDQLDLHGVLVTADALHAQRGHADYLHQRGGHYLMTIKANQPTLLSRLRALPWAQIGVAARERARGHGRVETRTISVVSLHPCPDLGAEFFPHAAQAIKLVRRRRPLHPGATWKTETVYAITSLTGTDADPSLLARWIRGHWSIENRLHWVRDVSFDEDRATARTGHAPHVMSTLRNLAITALRLSGATNIAAALRHHARNPLRPLITYKIT
ncbi:ISAs1 family transposase [Pseudonocardia asaccharolytica]|uniref:ISAs1 family transposase n=1 Tax=Pseudonocardia asaccharolytica DSM 44247 = NBRC 16224 TaxID=1123024 RepID=A0A511D7Z8_9PSEU|nr:ISAs1 family transposase [Pseudonocardia asaccharolytica]GEL20892.1 ISAs1 family transposase [Pseudonocardia asaccharolytica DSM 44247 = NBRC 16224]